MPLWLPRPEYDGLGAHDVAPSLEAGLTIRPLAETVRDTNAWLDATPEAAVSGISLDRERELLDAWGPAANAANKTYVVSGGHPASALRPARSCRTRGTGSSRSTSGTPTWSPTWLRRRVGPAPSQAVQGLTDVVHGLVPAAGIAGLTGADSALVVSVNYFGALALVRGLRPQLTKADRASVVLLASNSMTCQPGWATEVTTACLKEDEAGGPRGRR